MDMKIPLLKLRPHLMRATELISCKRWTPDIAQLKSQGMLTFFVRHGCAYMRLHSFR